MPLSSFDSPQMQAFFASLKKRMNDPMYNYYSGGYGGKEFGGIYSSSDMFRPPSDESMLDIDSDPSFRSAQADIRGEIGRTYGAIAPTVMAVSGARGWGYENSPLAQAIAGRYMAQASSQANQGYNALRSIASQRYFNKLQAARQLAMLKLQYNLERDQQKRSFIGGLINGILKTGGTVAGALIGGPAGAAVGYGAGSSLGSMASGDATSGIGGNYESPNDWTAYKSQQIY